MGPVTPTEFTPFLSLAGGILIGLSAVMAMGFFGRIAGVSGITAGLLGLSPGVGGPPDRGWRIAFVSGLVAAPSIVLFVTGDWPRQTVSGNLPGMALAGLLVGFGTALGSGCTSGHGVCGLARLSRRSLAAVAAFLLAAVFTTTVLRHVI